MWNFPRLFMEASQHQYSDILRLATTVQCASTIKHFACIKLIESNLFKCKCVASRSSSNKYTSWARAETGAHAGAEAGAHARAEAGAQAGALAGAQAGAHTGPHTGAHTGTIYFIGWVSSLWLPIVHFIYIT